MPKSGVGVKSNALAFCFSTRATKSVD